MRLGAHLSIAGGVHHALEKAHQFGFDAMAMFVRNQRQWKPSRLGQEEVDLFRKLRKDFGIWPVAAHGLYLLNLCGRDEVCRRSIEAIIEDLRRCERLGVEYLVIHPGAHEDAKTGLRLIAQGLNQAIESAAGASRVLIETTAGAGTILGGTFEQVAEIIAQVKYPSRVGVCMDTCHIFAAGYEIRTRQSYLDTFEEFDRIVGLEKLFAIHLNDSLKDIGSHLDRHAHIGLGKLGLEPFRFLANDPRFKDLPMLLETPKGIREEDGRDWDEINGQTMRGLVR